MSLAYKHHYDESEVQVDWYERLMLTGGRAERRRRQAAKRRKLRKLVLLAFMAFLMASVLFGFISGLFKIAHLKAEINNVRSEIATVETEISQLEDKKVQVQSPSYVEQVAREKLGLVKPGEVKYIITEAQEGLTEQDVETRSRYDEPLY